MKRGKLAPLASMASLALVAAACSGFGDDGRDPIVRPKSFAPQAGLTALQIDQIVEASARATDEADVTIAVVDRLGNLLRLYRRGVRASFGDFPDVADILPQEDRAPLNFATSIARAAAYLSHSQAPLTSRTGQFLNTFHFPATFSTAEFLATPPFVFAADLPDHNGTLPIQRTLGVMNTPQAPLWQIDASNRGTTFAVGALTAPPTDWAGTPIPVLANPDPAQPVPSPGLGPLPGGVPLYLPSGGAPGFDIPERLAGAVGVYITDGSGMPLPDLAEFAAFEGSRGLGGPDEFTFFAPIPNEGAVFLVGILLPYLYTSLPAGANTAGTGPFAAEDEVRPYSRNEALAGDVAPEGYLIAPQSSTHPMGLTAAEVDDLIQSCVRISQATHAAIRVPVDSPCKMIISVCDRDGVLLGVFREEDATLFSLEISITKSRNAAFFSNPDSRWTSDAVIAGVLAGRHPLTGFRPLRDPGGNLLPVVDAAGNLISANGEIVDVFPQSVLESTGVAVTARTLGFLTQPFYPPGIDGSPRPGPLYHLIEKNRRPDSFDGQGFAARFGDGDPNDPLYDGVQSGIIFFPGSAPLYRDGVLIGGIGVSGDGVEQDDYVTAKGIEVFEGPPDGGGFPMNGFPISPPPGVRADLFSFGGTGLPYFKFPQHPGG